MSEERMNFTEEFPEAAQNTEQMDANIPEGHQEVAGKETYTLADGTEGSRAAFIREKFLQDNMGRKEIAETFGFPYRVVYSATVNMVNDAEVSGRGRSAANANIQVTADGQYVAEKDGVVYIDGEETTYTMEDLGELQTVSRNEWIVTKVQEGISRGDIAKMLGMSYGVVYNVTKELEGTREKHEITLEDGTVISRADYIRQLYAEGKTRGEIAKELNVAYTVVWQATKVAKSEQEKYQDCVESLRAYVDKVADPDVFISYIDALANTELKDESVEADTVSTDSAE